MQLLRYERRYGYYCRPGSRCTGGHTRQIEVEVRWLGSTGMQCCTSSLGQLMKEHEAGGELSSLLKF